jgi:hypothetical protein
MVLLLKNILQHGISTDAHIMDKDANLGGW